MIRVARADDLDAIVAIYNASVPGRLATADTEPVSVESRRAWFSDRAWDRHPLWVLETESKTESRTAAEPKSKDSRIAGWLSFGKFYGRPAYAATAEVSIYVDPAAQRAGVATLLLREAIARAPLLGLRTFVGFVFAHNARSVALCLGFGFQQWGLMPRVAVLDGVERDLLILGRRLDPPPPGPPPA